MGETLDVSTPPERRRKRVGLLLFLAAIAYALSGCLSLENTLERTAETVDDAVDTAEHMAYMYDSGRDAYRAVTRAKYKRTIENRSCADYQITDESGQDWLLLSGETTTVTIKSKAIGDRKIDLTRTPLDATDCRPSERRRVGTRTIVVRDGGPQRLIIGGE